MNKMYYLIIKVGGDYCDCYKLYEILQDRFDKNLWEIDKTKDGEYADYEIVFHLNSNTTDDTIDAIKIMVQKVEYEIPFELVDFVED